MRKSRIALLALSALYVKLIWILHPHADLPYTEVPTFQLFPLAKDIMISKPTYIAFACNHVVWLIFISVCWFTLEKYRVTFAVLFLIQFLQFIEYFFTYNRPFNWQIISIFGHEIEIGLTLVKLIVPACICMYQVIWKNGD